MPSDFRIPESLRHFSGMVTFLAYDAAGNLLSDGNCSYTWDGEERLATATCPGSGTTTYIYDAEGRRVAKAVGTTITEEYVYNQAGQVVSAYGPYPSMTWLRDEVYAGGRHLATYANGTTYFHHADQVGSERVRTGVNGAAVENCTNLPFGDGESCTAADPTPSHFTGLERDPETSNDHAWFRYLSSSQGRWLSPDPLGGDVTNPQSLNRYAYVLNNPTNLIDPLGLDSGGCVDFANPDGSIYTFCAVVGNVRALGAAGGTGTPECPSCIDLAFRPSFQPLQDNGPEPHLGGGPGGLLSPFGIRSGNQTYSQYLSANKNTYSIGGAIELTADVAFNKNTNISEKTNFLTGNGITNLFFDGPGAGDFLNIASSGAGSPLTFGRRTSDILSLNLAGKGGLPRALGSSGAKGFLESAGRFLNLGLDEAEKFAVDAGLAGAEAINCAISAGNLVP